MKHTVALETVFVDVPEAAVEFFEAALNCKKNGINAMPEIEIPNIISTTEFQIIIDIIRKVAKETKAEANLHYKIGTMIEFPRAAIVADELAKLAEFLELQAIGRVSLIFTDHVVALIALCAVRFHVLTS